MAAHGSAPPPPQPPTGDPLGDLQEHLRAYSKAVADTIWELQQMKQPDPARVDALADALAGMADRLDGPGGLVDGLPDYPRDPACVSWAGHGGAPHEGSVATLIHQLAAHSTHAPRPLPCSKVKARLGELRAEHDALEPALLGVLADVGAWCAGGYSGGARDMPRGPLYAAALSPADVTTTPCPLLAERQQARLQEGVVAAVAPLLGAAGADKGGGVPAR